MTQEGAVPPGLWDRVRQEADKAVARYARSGPLRNSSLSSDASLTIKGGFIRLLNHLGRSAFYIGPVLPSMPDGTEQHGMIIQRSDGTQALALFDAFPAEDGTLDQALTWYDRAGHVVLADDTDGGEGLARPWIPGVWGLARAGDWPAVSSGSFETVYRSKMPKQHPRLRMAVWGWSDTAGATGEIRVMVNGTQFDTTKTTGNSGVGEFLFGPAAVPTVNYMSEMVVEVQARVASGAGSIRCAPSTPPEGRQT